MRVELRVRPKMQVELGGQAPLEAEVQQQGEAQAQAALSVG